MSTRKELSFDGFGINGPDEFRSRIATFAPTCKGEERDRYGELFENAPEMYRVLVAWSQWVREHVELHHGKREARLIQDTNNLLEEFSQ